MGWFELLSVSRRMSESGPMGLSPSDVLAWSELTGNAITSVEYGILTAMDAAYLAGMYEHREAVRAKYQVDEPKTKPPRKRAPK